MFLVPGPGRQCDRASACNSVWGGPNPLCGHLWQQCQVTPHHIALHITLHCIALHCIAMHSSARWPYNLHCIGQYPHSKLRLIFHADGADQEKRGFLVKINASVEGGHLDFDLILVLVLYEVYWKRFLECGGQLEGSSGVFQSPGYPHSYPHRHMCLWTITVPEGRWDVF